ncbi:ATP-grasp domain-containing protein [Acidisphaera sp. S103]|uniref:ATP-grasp domain-containing protein n=1 Tax=Acidisphaera sp. S103 TaxID=1747223 RepID=UPI001C202B48|nr:ATP-grasp domain-containing protein [Acidisphaera sp. S103]
MTPTQPAVLIAALSGRALAACARRDGYRPLVADLFGDLDTSELAEASERVPGTLTRGFSQTGLLASLDRLAAERQVIGVVVGSGFEDRPRLLHALATHHILLGNPAEVVTAIKDPFQFAETCARAGLPHPDIRRDQPTSGKWLRKRAGGSGGVHIAASTRRAGQRPGRYYQRHAAGEPVSVAFLAAGGACRVLGLSRQWADPSPRHPFRYGGASRPAPVPPRQAADIADAVARLVALTDLRGLNSADFLVRHDGLDLLEINPRPGATVDIFAGQALFRLHLDACRGVLPDAPPVWPAAAAAATVYARQAIRLPPDFAWPAWTADRQPSGEPVPAGAPLCTVLADAADATGAEQLVRDRAAEILASAEAPP